MWSGQLWPINHNHALKKWHAFYMSRCGRLKFKSHYFCEKQNNILLLLSDKALLWHNKSRHSSYFQVVYSFSFVQIHPTTQTVIQTSPFRKPHAGGNGVCVYLKQYFLILTANQTLREFIARHQKSAERHINEHTETIAISTFPFVSIKCLSTFSDFSVLLCLFVKKKGNREFPVWKWC